MRCCSLRAAVTGAVAAVGAASSAAALATGIATYYSELHKKAVLLLLILEEITAAIHSRCGSSASHSATSVFVREVCLYCTRGITA